VHRPFQASLEVESRRQRILADLNFISPEILTAALLHDVLDKKYVSAEEATDPYAFFLPLFRTWAAHGIDLVSDGRGHTIARIIDNVSWSTEKKLRETGQWTTWHDTCIELHCVQDADRLDAIGAFGENLNFPSQAQTVAALDCVLTPPYFLISIPKRNTKFPVFRSLALRFL